LSSIYDPVEIESPKYVHSPDLEAILRRKLKGLCVKGLSNRPRSKLVKSQICRVMGWAVPSSFKAGWPQFPGQNFNVHTQKESNFQPTENEKILPERRYVFLRPINGKIEQVRVVTGETLALLDTRGKVTVKHQARIPKPAIGGRLLSKEDRPSVTAILATRAPATFSAKPTHYPERQMVLQITIVFRRLKKLVGATFKDEGIGRERNRGGALHRLVCEALGYRSYADDNSCPDVKHQILEVKCMLSTVIDLGITRPDSETHLDIPPLHGVKLRHYDVRYAIFSAVTNGAKVTIKGFYLCTGKDFYANFPQSGTLRGIGKRQMTLPVNFFEPK
jgi:hypothetical protein